MLRAVQAVLICISLYLGWALASKLVELDPQARGLVHAGAVPPTPASDRSSAQSPTPNLEDPQAVWGRNLYAESKNPEQTAVRKRAVPDRSAFLGSQVGLSLIGTVVADTPYLNYAVIEVTATRSQGIYRQGDLVARAVIKSILRNIVIIEVEGGQLVQLTAGGDAKAIPAQEGMSAVAESLQSEPVQTQTHEESIAVELPLDDVASSLADIPSVIRELIITPQIQNDQLNGFSIGRLRAHDVLFRIGLRTGDLIKGVDDKQFTSPEEAQEIFERLLEGGDISVLIERRGRPQRMQVHID